MSCVALSLNLWILRRTRPGSFLVLLVARSSHFCSLAPHPTCLDLILFLHGDLCCTSLFSGHPALPLISSLRCLLCFDFAFAAAIPRSVRTRYMKAWISLRQAYVFRFFFLFARLLPLVLRIRCGKRKTAVADACFWSCVSLRPVVACNWLLSPSHGPFPTDCVLRVSDWHRQDADAPALALRSVQQDLCQARRCELAPLSTAPLPFSQCSEPGCLSSVVPAHMHILVVCRACAEPCSRACADPFLLV